VHKQGGTVTTRRNAITAAAVINPFREPVAEVIILAIYNLAQSGGDRQITSTTGGGRSAWRAADSAADRSGFSRSV